MMKVLQILVNAILAVALIALLPFAWLMRDGLGPDSTRSVGMAAVSRCLMTFYSGPTVIALILLAVVCHRIGKRDKPRNADSIRADDPTDHFSPPAG